MPTILRQHSRLQAFYEEVRTLTRQLSQPLTAEDMLVQSMPSASPTKWHLAHTTWFFETFILSMQPGYRSFDPRFGFLFNSYYNTIGDRIARTSRGHLSRPTIDEILNYRQYVDTAMGELLASNNLDDEVRQRIIIGLHHEQQHQELLLTDIKHAFGINPLSPPYREGTVRLPRIPPPLRWLDYPGGLLEIGHQGDGFAYDNESPTHKTYLQPYRLASRLTTCGEFISFLQDGGYKRPELWLSDGWDAVRQQGWSAPLYWINQDGQWWHYTLQGMQPVLEDEPICHVSYYEADAFARWTGARLPTEAEWESASRRLPVEGSFLDSGNLHPSSADGTTLAPMQMFGEVWQWTSSPYVAYPGYRSPEGALGEYNGKFMCNQFVLRGGSCFTPRSHFRPSYRNFFPPEARWQISGIRLAEDA